MVSLSLKKFFDEWLKKTKAEGERERDREELWPLGNIFSLEKYSEAIEINSLLLIFNFESVIFFSKLNRT